MARMTASEAFVETLVAYGVRNVFGIVGSAYMDALDLFPAAGIRFIPTAHEQGAGHMADGYSRASGKPGVCIAQNGPGITNFVTAVAAAYWAHSPGVVITPETGSNTQGLGCFQETEQLPFFEKITKYQVHCPQQVRLAEHLSAPVVSTYLHNDSFPKSHHLWCGPIGYQGSKAAMKLLAQADVVLALGTRLGPFGTLPQHGIEYWPKDAKLIQVDANPRKLGLVKQAAVGICGDAKAAAQDLLVRLETGNRAIAAHATREDRLAEIRRQKQA